MWAKGRECSDVLVRVVGQGGGGEVQGEGGEAVCYLAWGQGGRGHSIRPERAAGLASRLT